MTQKWHRQLARQLIRSLNEHPEDWEITSQVARNKNLRIYIWASRLPGHMYIDWKGNRIVGEYKWIWMPWWRRDLFAAIKRTAPAPAIVRLTLALSDTLEPLPKKRWFTLTRERLVRHSYGRRA